MKISLVYSSKKSSWKSCQVISTNLLEMYNQAYPRCYTSHNLSDKMSDFEVLNLAKDVFKDEPTHVSFIDHKPHPHVLLKYLDYLYSQNPKIIRPEIIFHVFGDFTLFGKDWKKCEPYLKNFKVKLIAASDRQKDLISKFMKKSKTGIYKCPFPVDHNSFYFSEEMRKKKRKELGLDDKVAMYIYTGRMSLQKNILDLVLGFSHFSKTANMDACLYLAGEFDDLGNPFTGAYFRNGEFYQYYIKMFNDLDEKAKSRVKFIGNLNQEELLDFYNAADCFISLSVHNDEDYGMSPAEAMCTGLPAILTDWAGYASFDLNGENACALIPTEIDRYNISFNRKELLKKMMTTSIRLSEHRKNRNVLSKKNINAFSVEGNVLNLKGILEDEVTKFSGFSANMDELALVFSKNQAPFAKNEPVYTPFYKNLYTSYVRK